MAKFLVLWHVNWSAPWPTDPNKNLELNEMMWTAIDGLRKNGQIEEFGAFPDGTSGYGIAKGEATDVLRGVSMFQPFVVCEVKEIIPFEKQKEVQRSVMKAQIEATKK